MALSPLQAQIAQLVAGLPEAAGFALAGAGGLTVWGVVDRRTRDLDYFATDPAAVAVLLPALEAELERHGIIVERQRVVDGFVRLSATVADEVCEIDLAHDARLFPAQQTEFGRVLALEELAADKMLALFGRAQPRDFLDVEALLGRFGAERLLQLAAQKDAGFDLGVFAGALGSLRRFGPEDLNTDDSGFDRLAERMEAWRRELVQVVDARSRRLHEHSRDRLHPGEPPEPAGLDV